MRKLDEDSPLAVLGKHMSKALYRKEYEAALEWCLYEDQEEWDPDYFNLKDNDFSAALKS